LLAECLVKLDDRSFVTRSTDGTVGWYSAYVRRPFSDFFLSFLFSSLFFFRLLYRFPFSLSNSVRGPGWPALAGILATLLPATESPASAVGAGQPPWSTALPSKHVYTLRTSAYSTWRRGRLAPLMVASPCRSVRSVLPMATSTQRTRAFVGALPTRSAGILL